MVFLEPFGKRFHRARRSLLLGNLGKSDLLVTGRRCFREEVLVVTAERSAGSGRFRWLGTWRGWCWFRTRGLRSLSFWRGRLCGSERSQEKHHQGCGKPGLHAFLLFGWQLVEDAANQSPGEPVLCLR